MKMKSILTVILIFSLLFGLSALFFLREKDDYSPAERRALAKMPILTKNNLLSGQYAEEWETFALDQFPMRDSFRTLKALVSFGFFGRKENNRLFTAKGHLSKLDDPLREDLILLAKEKLRGLYEANLKDTDCSIYFAVIPDKNFFLAHEVTLPVPDYEKLISELNGALSFARPIPLADTLSLDCFYKTDLHWRNERLLPAAKRLAEAMVVPLAEDFKEKRVEKPFSGVYVGQSALPFPAEEMLYLTSDAIERATVTDYDTGQPRPASVYDEEKADGRDGYDFFLAGATALITIENGEALTEKELVVFRDSFASSLIPLLIPSYRKITLIDPRYLEPNLIGRFVSFERQDVLFLFSSSILANATVFK